MIQYCILYSFISKSPATIAIGCPASVLKLKKSKVDATVERKLSTAGSYSAAAERAPVTLTVGRPASVLKCSKKEVDATVA
jgi:hypothetical protein